MQTGWMGSSEFPPGSRAGALGRERDRSPRPRDGRYSTGPGPPRPVAVPLTPPAAAPGVNRSEPVASPVVAGEAAYDSQRERQRTSDDDQRDLDSRSRHRQPVKPLEATMHGHTTRARFGAALLIGLL